MAGEGGHMTDTQAIDKAGEDAFKTLTEMATGGGGGAETETKPAETKPAETKPAETKPTETGPDDYRYDYQGQQLTKDEVDYLIGLAQYAVPLNDELQKELKELKAAASGKSQEGKEQSEQTPEQKVQSAIESRLKSIEDRLETNQKKEETNEKKVQAEEIQKEFKRLIQADDLLGRLTKDPAHLSKMNAFALIEQSTNPRAKFSDSVAAVKKFIGDLIAADRADYLSGKIKAEQSAPPSGTSAPPKEPAQKFDAFDVWGGGKNADAFERAVAETIDLVSKH